MFYFLDTSALVKRYRQEEGTELIDKLFEDTAETLIISGLSISETVRAFDKHLRQGVLSHGDIKLGINRLYLDYHSQRIAIVDIRREHIFLANDLILQYHLYTPDALILAAALKLREYSPIFVCSDVRSGLLQAAEACHLSTLNPLNP